MKIEKLLEGAYDLHIHAVPDVVPRAQTLPELAKAAARVGMAGVLIKDHTASTVGRCFTMNEMSTGSARFLSALALNPPVGGLNPCAVESALREGADIIYFPTYGAKNHIAIWGAGKPPTAFPLPGPGYPGLSLLDGNGKPREECETILRLIAGHDAVMATGHISPAESLALIKLAVDSGCISLFVGISTGTIVALTRFPGRRIVVSLINTGMGVPPVVVGLFVSIFLWRNGPFGMLELLYTPTAIIIAQAVIATPIVAGISLASIQKLPEALRLQILALGATRFQMIWMLIKEARLPLLAAVMAGFGGVISEVGASIMVGGNIKGYTRVLTTATVMETGRGNFDVAIALGVILLFFTFCINAILTSIQQRERPR